MLPSRLITVVWKYSREDSLNLGTVAGHKGTSASEIEVRDIIHKLIRRYLNSLKTSPAPTIRIRTKSKCI